MKNIAMTQISYPTPTPLLASGAGGPPRGSTVPWGTIWSPQRLESPPRRGSLGIAAYGADLTKGTEWSR